MQPAKSSVRLAALALGLSLAAPAAAIPAFARKYTTSCLTCHTVYPKLTPFGEAFRANGYRFPGVDGDFIKAEQVPLGQEASKKTFPNSVWPASIPASVPLAVGVNGTALVFPSKHSTAGVAANGTRFTTQDLVGEAHLWFGASLDDSITLWGELTLAGSADVEHAQILFNDLLGPGHAVNLIVGHGFPNVTQYGPHSSYLADVMLPTVPVTAIYGTNPDGWSLTGNYTGLEANGVIAGRFDWALGLNAGPADRVASTDNVYGRIGFKLGGMRLDGEGSSGAADALRPWAEDAVGAYLFGYQANSRFTDPVDGTTLRNDVAKVVGLGARAQFGSAELNAAYYTERHNHGTDAFDKVTANVWFGELSYVLFPWMVPAVRVEGVSLKPTGGDSVSTLHVMPGIAFAIRPNVKLVAVANFERSNGFPSTGGPVSAGGTPVAWQGGAADWGGIQIGPSSVDPTRTRISELESIAFFLAWAM
jgi:hypothetical protein